MFCRTSKRFGVYEAYTTYIIPLFLVFLYLMVLGFSARFVYQGLIQDFDPSVFVLLLVLDGPFVFVTIQLFREKFLQRLLLRIEIKHDGIHGSGLGWEKFKITWDSIRTFGIVGASSKVSPRKLILFSTDKKELFPRNTIEANKVSSERLVFQYRRDVWDALSQYMPQDMLQKLNYALMQNRDCFHKR